MLTPRNRQKARPERVDTRLLESYSRDGEKSGRRQKRWIRPLVGICLGCVVVILYGRKTEEKPMQEKKESLPLPCSFDGHCPVRATCSVTRGETLGVCEDIIEKEAKPASSQCVEACRKELEWDEHFYQERWPVVEKTASVLSEGRPEGCMLVYSREADRTDEWKDLAIMDAADWFEVPPSIRKWEKNRFRHIKRVDPYRPDDLSDKRWMAYCTSPCESDTDCVTKSDKDAPGFLCREGSCQRNDEYWQVDNSMVVVTGASSTYYRGLANFAASVRYWAPDTPLVVYNLGLTPDQKKEIRSWSNVLVLEWGAGTPEYLPPHFSVKHTYAWKPYIIREALEKYHSIFWLDAGSTLTGPIAPAIKITQQTGMFLVKGQDTDMRRSHPSTFLWFNTTRDELRSESQGHFSGNTQAYLYPSRYYDSVVNENARCALDSNCISPVGSDLGNHRYDQTALSIACYHPKVRAPHYTEYLAADAIQLQSDLTLPSFKFVWTSRTTSFFYSDLVKWERE